MKKPLVTVYKNCDPGVFMCQREPDQMIAICPGLHAYFFSNVLRMLKRVPTLIWPLLLTVLAGA